MASRRDPWVNSDASSERFQIGWCEIELRLRLARQRRMALAATRLVYEPE